MSALSLAQIRAVLRWRRRIRRAKEKTLNSPEYLAWALNDGGEIFAQHFEAMREILREVVRREEVRKKEKYLRSKASEQ